MFIPSETVCSPRAALFPGAESSVCSSQSCQLFFLRQVSVLGSPGPCTAADGYTLSSPGQPVCSLLLSSFPSPCWSRLESWHLWKGEDQRETQPLSPLYPSFIPGPLVFLTSLLCCERRSWEWPKWAIFSRCFKEAI